MHCAVAPERQAHRSADVAVGDDAVQIFYGTILVPTRRRVREPYARALEPAHVSGLWRVAARTPAQMPWPVERAKFVAASPAREFAAFKKSGDGTELLAA